MVILAGGALAVVGQVQQFSVIHAGLDRLTDSLVGERRLVHLHPGDAGLRRGGRVHHDPRQLPRLGELTDIKLVNSIDLLGAKRLQPSRLAGAEIDIDDFVEERRFAPIILPAVQHYCLT